MPPAHSSNAATNMTKITKSVESERVHIDVDGQHSTIVTFDDGSEETFTGFRKLEPEDIGKEAEDIPGAVAIVKMDGVLHLYFLMGPAWPTSNADQLGHYIRSKAEGGPSSIMVLNPEWAGKMKE